jgi:hypothetical protein
VGDAAPPPPPPDDPEPVVNGTGRSHHQHPAPSIVQGPTSLPRLLAWADQGAMPPGTLWPAYRLVGMHAPDASATDPRMTTFGALWRSAVHDLVERLVRQFAWERTGVVGFARLGAGR